MEKIKSREGLSSRIIQAESRVQRLIRAPSLALVIAAVLYLVLIIVAEIVVASGRVLVGSFLDGAVLVILINLYYFIKKSDLRRLILAFELVPLMRLLSLAIPVPQIPHIYWYALIGFPLLLAAMIVVYQNGLPQLTQNQSALQWFIQTLFGLFGIPLGFLAGRILPPPAPILPGTSLGWILLGTIILTLSTGFAEEIIFRGLVQNAITEIFGFIGVFITSLLYTYMLVGTLEARYILFFGLTGFLFSLWVKLTKSLWGAILAHSMLNIIFLLLLVH